MPQIIVTRDSGWADCARKYRLLLDGVEVARIPDGGTVTIEAPPGRHRLKARIDWLSTEEIEFDPGDGPAAFHVYSKLRGLRVLLTIVAAFVPGMWFGLRQVSPPAQGA